VSLAIRDASDLLLDKLLVNIAPAPILTRFERPNDGVRRGVKMLGGVFVFGLIAATDVAAGQAHPQVDPVVAQL
jgi:hypothetical protein